MSKVLIVEDDKMLGGLIKDWLSGDGYTVELVESGLDAQDRLRFYSYDAIVLDLALPIMSGLEVLREFRSRGGNTPVIILTAKTSVPDRERGLDAGADDYLVKPFAMRELSARLRALLRRPPVFCTDVLTFEDLVLDSGTHKAHRNGREIKLSPTEFTLLEFLMRNPERVFSAEAIISRLWPNDSEISTDAIRIYINRLRNKVEQSGESSLITTVRGVGYKLASCASTKE